MSGALWAESYEVLTSSSESGSRPTATISARESRRSPQTLQAKDSALNRNRSRTGQVETSPS
jgi:hypothetical protein